MRWFRRKAKEPATIESVSSTGETSLSAVRAAVHRCSASQEKDLVAAWRELAEVTAESVTTLVDVVAAEPQGSRLRSMARLVEDEIWSITEPWLNLNFVVTHRVAIPTEGLSNLPRVMLRRAEAALTAYRDASGDDRVAAQARLQQVVDDVDAFKDVPAELMSARHRRLWRLVADEIAEFAAEALARPHPTA